MSRPRGFAPYSPRGNTLELISLVQDVLDDYSEQLPLTLRQIYYRAVSLGALDKTEKDYSRLCEVMSRARRGGLIPMDTIRDDGFTRREPNGWNSEGDFLKDVEYSVSQFRLDRQQGQDTRLVIWCEATGMVPQLEAVTADYGVPVCSSGGFDSLTSKHDAAQWISEQGDTTVLHIGDHDPSGVHMFGALDQDVSAFIDHYSGSVNFVRLAVTPEQIEQYQLPTAPPKKTDNRAFTGLTTQAEALDPRMLAGIVRDAIEQRQDETIRQAVIASEQQSRERFKDLITINQI